MQTIAHLGAGNKPFCFFSWITTCYTPPKKSPVDDYHGRHWPVGMAPLECWQRKSKTSHSRNGPKGTTSMTHSQAVRSVPRSIEKLWHWEKVGYIIWDDIRIVSTSTFSLYLWTWRNTLNCWSTLPVLRRSWRSRDYNGAIRNDKWITIGFIYIYRINQFGMIGWFKDYIYIYTVDFIYSHVWSGTMMSKQWIKWDTRFSDKPCGGLFRRMGIRQHQWEKG